MRLFNTLPNDQHYWAWFMDTNSRRPDSGNMLADDPMDPVTDPEISISGINRLREDNNTI
jgi:hypothetical protein